MTIEQEQIAEILISEMKHKKGNINWKTFRDTDSIDPNDMITVIKALKELEIIENFNGDTTIIRLTEKNGWKFPGFEAKRHLEQTQKLIIEEKDKYDILVKKWTYKTRLVPYVVSFFALIVSILAYCKKA